MKRGSIARALAALFGAAVLALASAASADAPSAPAADRVRLDLGLGTDFPVSMGATASAELPVRVLLRLDVGFMPKPYAYTINDLLVAVGSYDDAVATLIKAALSSSFVLHPAVGWRPLRAHGLEVSVGYTLVTLGGDVTGADALNALLQEKGSTTRVSSRDFKDVGVEATLHNVELTVGWRWLLWDDRLVLRADVSYLQCVAASSGVSLSSSSRAASRVEPALDAAVDGYLSPYFTTYVKTPTIGLRAQYRFTL